MSETVASPCIDVCRMNPRTQLCDGCFRTIDEIAGWSSSDDAQKRAVLNLALKRPRVVCIGERMEATLELPPDSIKSFATRVIDQNPLHHDDAYAAASQFGSLIASGTQPTAHLMAVLATHFSAYAQPLGLEFGIKLVRAVKANDVLTLRWLVTDAHWKASLNADLVKLVGQALNQLGETVVKATATIAVMPREIRK